MTDNNETWRAHQPGWYISPDPDFPGGSIISCSAGDLDIDADANDTYVFAEHLAEAGAPDYMVRYFKDWAMHVEAPTGRLDRDAVARELFDYGVVMEQASIVYSELADLSKPNTAARHILAGAERRYRETYADFLCDHAYSEEDPKIKAALIEIANGWHPEAWEEHRTGRERTAKMLAS